MSTTNEEILHYQRKIVKYNSDAKVLLHCLGKLARLPIGVEHLQETGIGRTINGMRKSEGSVGEEARALVNKWKEMVAAEDKSDEENEVESEQPKEPKVKESTKELKETSKETKESPKEDRSKASSSSKSKRNKSPERASKSDDKKDRKEGGSSKSGSSKSSKKRHRTVETNEEETGGSFADALGSIDTSPKKKKSKDKEKNREEKKQKLSSTLSSSSSTSAACMLPPPPVPVAAKPAAEVRPLDFEISPNYKPLPLKFVSESPMLPKAKFMSAEEALNAAMSQKGSRTKVFSGNKSTGLSYVPSLFQSCIRVLQQNIDALECTGGVPFDLMRPVLERASPQQLYSLENFNPYFLKDTDDLWKLLCQKEYRKAVREEMESWRDLYLRCHEEREARLKSLTSKNKSAMATATPVRTTKLTYIESVAKNPRGSTKRNGNIAVMESITKSKGGVRPFEASANQSGASGAVLAEVVRVAAPASSRSSANTSSAQRKPKMAPLMQKTMKFIKNRYRR